MFSSIARPSPAYRGVRAAHMVSSSPADLSIRQVTTLGERLASEHLVRRMYSWRGYRVAFREPKPDDGQRVTLGAWHGGELAATLTMAVDRGQGLLCEALYPGEIAGLRQENRRLCEYSRFAVNPAFSSQKLLRAFFRNAYHLTHRILEATHAVIEVNPRHSRFYEQGLGFGRLGSLRICPRVAAPALLLHRDLHLPLPATLQDEPASSLETHHHLIAA
ncbi:MAG TPA: hypothetical protein VF096_07335 [Azonexus sp.]